MKKVIVLLVVLSILFSSCAYQKNYQKEDYLLEQVIEWSVERYGTMPHYVDLRSLPNYIIIEWYFINTLRMIITKSKDRWEILSFVRLEKEFDPNYELDLRIEFFEKELKKEKFKPKCIKDRELKKDKK